MAAPIPTDVPTNFTAGDTVTWKISLGDFLAGDGWVLSYAFVRRGGADLIQVTSAASNNDHLVTITAAASSNYVPGEYEGQGYVTSGSERYQVWSGLVTVNPNFVTSSGEDRRSNARKIFEALENAILKVSQAQAAGTAGGIVQWQAEGLSIRRASPEALLLELTKQRDRYAAICAQEDAQAKIAAGKATGRRILYEFTAP